MRIGLDARFFGPSVGTGIGRYTQRLIEELERIDSVNSYRVFLRQDNFDAYAPKNPHFTKVLAPWRWYSVDEQVRFPNLVRRERLDFMHYLHFNVPLFAPNPFIVTIHDLILSKFPTQRASTLEPIRYWCKQFAYRAVIRSAIRRAKRVIAVTEFTRQDVIDHFGYQGERVAVTYEGFDPPQHVEESGNVLARFRIEKPYLLCVGNAYPHKNLDRLIDATVLLRERGRSERLVLVGRDDFFYRRLKEYVRRVRADAFVTCTGYVSDVELDVIYRNAALYVFPSRYEGFGLPGIEAMAHDVPVVAARASCLPEVYGDAAVYFSPVNVREMADTIARVLSDPAGMRELRVRGRARIERYSWARMAEGTLSVYNSFA